MESGVLFIAYVATNSAYTTNIVQPIIHKLSDLGLVEVDSIVFRKKSFARAFRIADNSKNVLSGMFLEEYQSFRQLFADSYLLAPLVESELKNPLSSQAEIERLEEILETAKKKLR